MRARLYLRLWLWSKALERRCWEWAVQQNSIGEWVRISQERQAKKE